MRKSLNAKLRFGIFLWNAKDEITQKISFYCGAFNGLDRLC